VIQYIDGETLFHFGSNRTIHNAHLVRDTMVEQINLRMAEIGVIEGWLKVIEGDLPGAITIRV